MCNYSIITVCLSNIVTGIGVVGFLEIKIKKKPQKNFQTDFIKLILEHRKAAQKKGKVLQVVRGLLCLAAFISWGQESLGEKAGFLKVVNFLKG